LGHLYGFTGNTDKQILNYRKTERIATSIQDTVMLALVNMNLTWAYTSVGKLDSALFCGKKSLEYYSGLPNFGGKRYYESEALRDVGEVYRKMGKIGMAKQTLLQAIKVGTEQNNLSVLGYAYFSFADLYYGEKKADSSLFYARRALGVANQVKDESLKARIFDLLYSIYFKKSQPDSAFAYLKLSHALKDSLNNDERKKIREFQNMGFDEQLRLDELEKEKIQTQSNIRTYSLLAGLAILSVIGFILYRNNRQKQKANKVLESTLTNLKATQAQLIQSEKLASLGELTAGIAHEIQNPLNFVNNFSEMSVELVSELLEERNKENGKRDEELEKELLHDLAQNQEKINHHGKRASSIVKGMLEHSRASTGVRELTDINKLADEYLRLTYHGLRAKDKDFNAELITEFDENLPKIEVIPQDIGRVLLNLINNAFWAVKTVEKPLVVVKTEQADNQIIIKVSDNGIGMTEDVKAKIFQPFFTTKPTGEGTGLGLSLAYDIVTKGHEGTIEVESVEGEGTTFVVKLPSSAINSQ
jgi:signal transduction histidine kinase